MAVKKNKLPLRERGKRRFLSGHFVNIAMRNQSLRQMGNTLQAIAIETIQYYFNHAEVEYTETKEGLYFETKVHVAGMTITVSDTLTEKQLNQGYL